MPSTIANTADTLNRYAVQYNSRVQQELRTGLECEQAFTPRACDNTYSAPNATAGDVVQPYQWQFTPTHTVEFDAEEWKLRKIKVDVRFTGDELEQYFDSWKVEWHEIGKDPADWMFPRYLYDEVLMPKILEEMNNNAMNGEYTAPTPGTAGVSINSVDGYIKGFRDGVANGSIVEVVTGVIGSADAVQKIEVFCDGLPEKYRDLPGTIYCSHTVARYYARDYRGQFGYGNGVAGNENTGLNVDYSNKRVVPMHCLAGSNGLIFVPDSRTTLIWGTRQGFNSMPVIRWETEERVVKGLTEFYRFYGYEWGSEVFINDQFTPVV